MKNIKIIQKGSNFLINFGKWEIICSAFSFLGKELRVYYSKGIMNIPLHSGDTVEYRNRILK